MGRPSRPWYRADRDAWVTRIDGRYVTLARGKRNRAEANRELRRLLAQGMGSRSGSITITELCDRLLVHTRDTRSASTLEWYKRHLDAFVGWIGPQVAANAVRAFHVLDWLDSRAWGQATRHGAITAVKRAFRWGTRVGLIESNPMEGLDRPGMPRRELILSPEEERLILATATGPLLDYLVVIHETGCRPSEVARMEAGHLSGAVATMQGKSTWKTGRDRVIYLTPRAAEIVARLAKLRPEGPIFRGRRGGTWTRHALARAMGRLRRELGMGGACTASSFRHGWVTEAKLRMPNSVVAELAGHSSTAMVDRHYGHLSERPAELARAASTVRGSGTDTVVPSGAPARPPVAPPPDTTSDSDPSPRP